ncbi:MAG: acyl carrier protein [Lachnospiraceae bacterium]|nr:acyl carrier protein [Lachnospiraceae bacterium]MBQ9593786.1 acyl carrier protein [Lachnospiraceae bacterium]MBR0153085.1 acyl carrier protein [Lachnospiraceae bacterium]
MEEILAMLSELNSSVDFATAENIMSSRLLDSIDIIELVSKLEDAFDIEIGMEYMDKENFESAQAIWEMVQEIQEG